MATQFTSEEWKKINAALSADEAKYGLPQREYGSVLLGSFNIRKLGSSRSRSQDTWKFLAEVCRSFDLIAIQEIMDDMSGLRRLMSLLGPEFSMIVSGQTGKFPGEQGMGERLGFIYRWSIVERTEVATDITYDRTKILNSIATDYDAFKEKMDVYVPKWKAYVDGTSRSKPRLKMPVFISFIRQPFCVSFRIAGNPGVLPYEFMAVNAHLWFGQYIDDRRKEFNALMDWIRGRVESNLRAYYPNFILMGDLNLDFDNPENDRGRIEKYLESFDDASSAEVKVNFPFLNIQPVRTEIFRTNARMTETFDQIGVFGRDFRLTIFRDNSTLGQDPRGPDYGVFNFVRLFGDVLLDKPLDSLTSAERTAFFARFEHKVSDHMPLWVRLPMP